ncbi:fungal-specific transcription factor domain-containing protein [Thelonectria olida]|uniref:Fungal-specific transcription factor domain-containing protein n=1 Tax=Thelonectria olida TaxID=1576542 RepID=A0A9P8VZX9_9HYPO|nr:fungal-specific transcription factor domain-containing protein [Thelonectria olida]
MSRHMQEIVDEDEIDQVLSSLDSGGNGQVCGPFLVFPASNQLPPNPLDEVILSEPLPGASNLCSWPGAILEDSNVSALDDVLLHVENTDNPALDLSSFSMIPRISPIAVAQVASPSPLDLHIDDGFCQTLDASVSSHAHFLLEHYKSQTGKLFSPLRVKKSPWSILHFPRALSALSELSIFKNTKHAQTSLFYSVLAVSAFNWDNIHRARQKGTTTYWRSVGEGFRRGAKRELEWTCETELAGEKSSKYKDILMAILTMVTISVVTGQQEEARSYLLNAELFIGLRGAPKVNKSRKVKLLHSIYLFLRVIEESTYMYPPDKQPLASISRPPDEMLFPSLRTHSLCLGRDLDDSCGMDFEYGLFGELDNQKNPAFFKEIYGFPQELLSFISRATFLANQVAMHRRRFSELSMTTELEARCVALENEICAWNNYSDDTDGDADDPVAAFANRAIMYHLIAAFHYAVIIFFYRRVRQLNPFLLQPYVEKTIANLEAFEQEQRNFSLVNCGIVWPGFIAGAEAADPELQARFYKRLQECSRSSGMQNFGFAAEVLQELWALRRQKGREGITWMDVVRDRQLALVLT